jgi:hypothetical protein
LQGSTESLEHLVRTYVLTDDLDLIKTGISILSDVDASRTALKLFLQGRQTIETSWDYRNTQGLFREALETLDHVKPSQKFERITVNWLKKVVEGHSALQKAESAWTFCNFGEGRDAYLIASESFLRAQEVLLLEDVVEQYKDFREYSDGWQRIATGMYHNILACLLLREEKGDGSLREFESAQDLLLKAVESFARIGNVLGQHDARSYVMDPNVWRNQRMLTANRTEVRWQDYACFENDSTFERLLAWLKTVHSKYPSELLTRTGAEELRLSVADIGRLTISKIGDAQIPPLEVRIVFHPEYVLEVEYTLKLNTPLDAFTLYALKILNTEAVPTYEAFLQSEIQGLVLRHDDYRLKDVTRLILDNLAQQAGGLKGASLLDSFVMLHVYDYRPSAKVSDLGRGNFNYMNGLFSESDTLNMQPSEKDTRLPENLLEGIHSDGAAAYVSQRAAVFIVPELQEWEVKLYSEVLDYAVETRETTENMLIGIQREARELRAKLAVLKRVVSGNSSVSQAEVRKLISSNLDIRLKALRLFDIEQKHNVLKQTGIGDVRMFSARADEKLHLTEQFRQTESQLERIETLYNTAFNLGQDYLSLIIAVNSDISRRAFNVLNLVMMGSLGLAVTTAILITPISYTLAGLAVFATSFVGYIYLTYTKRKATRPQN